MVDKYLKSYLGATIKEAQKNITYRNIIMAPGHMVKKWKREIQDEIPFVKVEIINDFSQLIKLRQQKGQKPKGKEWYIISKDFCKLSYTETPASSLVKHKMAKVITCDCGKRHLLRDVGNQCSECKSDIYIKAVSKQSGIICPSCGELSIPFRSSYQDEEDISKNAVLTPLDFDTKKERNSTCGYCGASLWMPSVSNIDIGGEYSGFVNKKNAWKRFSFFRNRALKGRKSIWMLSKFIRTYIGKNDIDSKYVEETRINKVRKFAPEQYIKRQLGSNFFDFAVFDEVQDLKGGATAQGNAMHSLVVASKKQLALTGTIAGGYAEHLFFLLYRLDPRKMLAKGYKFSDSFQFSKDYGVIEESTIFSDAEQYNSSSRGKQYSPPTCKPGISPLIFPHFLLDCSIFLDLSDLSAFLPKLYEHVALFDMEDRVKECYNSMRSIFKDKLREPGKGSRIMSTMLTTLLSYPDMPSGVKPILEPDTGLPYIEPNDIDISEFLLPKEEYLVNLINSEISEERNCVVYAEYTGDGDKNVTDRLKSIIEHNCDLKGRVSVLKSDTVEPIDREEWMKQQAIKGMRVMITNPKCVATGIDFIFKENGKLYNFPTLIFYQMGTNLFVLWQAACRHYRLIQKEECRTYYLAYKNTFQESMLNLMAAKKVATAAIQGKFSSEGLAAMAQGVDTRLMLAKTLSDKAEVGTSNQSLEDMFEEINKTQNELVLTDEELEYIKMTQAKEEKTKGNDEMQYDLITLMQQDVNGTAIAPKPKKKVEVISMENFVENIKVKAIDGSKVKGKNKPITGQYSLF